MFTKKKEIGRGQYKVTQTVTDWESVFVAIFWVFIVIAVLQSCSG